MSQLSDPAERIDGGSDRLVSQVLSCLSISSPTLFGENPGSSTHRLASRRAKWGPDMSMRHLDQNQLAERWNVSPRTLERWRWLGAGPVYLKLGGRVSYRLEDVEHYEGTHLHANTSGPLRTEKIKS
jgi:hypothetical protein